MSLRRPDVKYVNLGSTGLRASRICLGMMSFGNDSERAWVLDEDAAEPIVKAAVEGGITFIKLMGVGMIVALVVDASIVRVMLVPATMRLLGRANWWAPPALRRLYARYGIRESDDESAAAPVRPAANVTSG